MEKLFDETNEFESKYYRTIWYGYTDLNLDKELADILSITVKNDLSKKSKHNITATHWVFYGKNCSEDAIDEKIRPSIMIRERDGVFVSNYNMSDFDFVTIFDVISEFKIYLENLLNS